MSRPSSTPSTIPAEYASQLSCDKSLGTEICCVNGGLFKLNMSINKSCEAHKGSVCSHGSVQPMRRLTFIIPFNTLLQPICWFSKAIPVYLSMDELKRGNQAELLLGVLVVNTT